MEQYKVYKKVFSLLIIALVIFSVSGCRKNSVDSVSSDASIPNVIEEESTLPESSDVEASSEENNESLESEVETPNSTNSSKQNTTTVCTHEYKSTVIEKTCTKDGYTQHVCNKCGNSYKDNVISASHNFVNYYCTICNTADKSNAGIIVYNWLQENGVTEQYYSSKVYNFGNGLYKISGLNNGWLYFEYNNDNEDKYIKLSVYSGPLKDDCYLEYSKGDSKVEYEFHKENIHSNQPNGVWNQMYHYGSIDKSQMISEIRSEIDGFMLQFQNNVLNKLGVSLKDLGFTCYN